ncbi:outer membrane lipoprotein carrier protein LolA [Trichlorobacter lovleyi]|uniref:LolA family protein n=1 Tax=Trichlorobacter lovleyi TaxID=313985 RepID=UPI00223FC5DE|nr:outer membrane lipoprotein carrier protein LolA [Trichlorobacter lovleyi]QOX79242.1 outer membrane lipoprotein carrier protein LolA [Trichlorobacter lovleyi]
MKPFLSCLLVCLLLTATLKAEARSLTPVEGLEALRRSFNSLQDFTAELTQEKQLSIMKKKLVMQGQIRFKKPDRFYMELVPPYSSKVLLKDTVLQQRLGSQGELQRIVLPPEQGLSRWFATLAKPVTTVPEGMEVRAEQGAGQTTVLIRPAKGGQLKELTIVLQDDGTVRRLVLEERAGDKTVMTFRKTRKNVGLTEADFRLE